MLPKPNEPSTSNKSPANPKSGPSSLSRSTSTLTSTSPLPSTSTSTSFSSSSNQRQSNSLPGAGRGIDQVNRNVHPPNKRFRDYMGRTLPVPFEDRFHSPWQMPSRFHPGQRPSQLTTENLRRFESRFQTPSQTTSRFQTPSQTTSGFQTPSQTTSRFQTSSQIPSRFQTPSQIPIRFQTPSQISSRFQAPSQQSPQQSTSGSRLPPDFFDDAPFQLTLGGSSTSSRQSRSRFPAPGSSKQKK